jgi:hypothetical protein
MGSNVSIKAVSFACAAGIALAGSIALASDIDRGAAGCPAGSEPARSQTAVGRGGGSHTENRGHGHRRGHAAPLVVGPTCNILEMVVPQSSTYRPDVRGATRADRARARTLLRGVNAFCRSHSASELMAGWVAADGDQRPPTHFFNPDRPGSLGLDPSNPRAVLVYGQEIGGVMFTGTPLPLLGSIPRAHTHDASRPREMLHVYCATNLAEAFTPSRQLGVLADSIALRQKVRPRVAQLVDPQLTLILRQVRDDLGGELPRVAPRTIATPEMADPILHAKREEIRQSLFLLAEPQLRTVLSMIKSGSRRPPS